jgi:acetolactate decarboxylase
MLDERLARSLHVESLRARDLHPEHEPHVLFQASTIGALLDGAYEGDVSFAQLAEHGDLGLGTFNALDGEMIALEGGFYRADVDGRVSEVDPETLTPFAAVTWFEPEIEHEIEAPLDHENLLGELIGLVGDAGSSFAVRIDGDFELVHARSVPRQTPPYRGLAEVAAAEQHVFDLDDVSGAMVGFRFPDYADGVEVTGYHLHFITDERDRGGHVLDCRIRSGVARIDLASDLHVELPPGVELDAPPLDEATRAALDRTENQG